MGSEPLWERNGFDGTVKVRHKAYRRLDCVTNGN